MSARLDTDRAEPVGRADRFVALVSAGPWKITLAVVLVFVASTLIGGAVGGSPAGAACLVAAASTAAFSCFDRARVATLPRTALILMGAGALVWAFGVVMGTVADVADLDDLAGATFGRAASYASIASGLVVIAAFAAVPITGPRVSRVRTVLDMATIVCAVLIGVVAIRLQWAAPATQPHLSAATLRPMLSLLTVGLAGATLARATPRWRPSLLTAWLGTMAFALSDVVIAVLVALGRDDVPVVATAGWVGGWLLIAVGVSAPVQEDAHGSVRNDPQWTSTIVTAATFALLSFVELSERTASRHRGLMLLLFLGFGLVLVRAVVFQIESSALHRTVREQAREAGERADRYEEALQAAGAGIWEYDAARDRFWSSRGLDHLLDREHTGPEPIARFLDSVTEPMRPQVRSAIERAVLSDEPISLQTVRREGGVERYLETRGRRRVAADGVGAVFAGVAIDVTERRLGELAVEQQARRADRLARLGRRALVADGFDAVIWDGLEAITGELGTSTVRVLRCEGTGLRPVARLGDGSGTSESIGRRVLATGSTAVLPPADDESAGVAMASPIVGRGGIWGLVALEFDGHRRLRDVDVSFVEAVAATIARAAALDEAQRELRHHVLHDQLTGLPNRALLVDRVGQLLRTERPDDVVVLYIGLDRFGTVNDSLGHAGGDAVLLEIAHRLAAVCPTGGSTGRMSGDEFALVFVADDVQIDDVVDAVRSEINRSVDIDGTEVVVAASVGGAQGCADLSADDVLANAATASNLASRAGGDRYRWFDDSDRRQSLERVRLASELRHALEAGQIVPWYQPIVRIADRRVVGAEALARWDRPGEGIVTPDRFIPVAEESGQICAIGRVILGRALEDLTRWTACTGGTCISVNVATGQLVDGSIVDALCEELERTGADASRLGLEIVEGEIADECSEPALHTIRRLKQVGPLKISVDDFGTGHSSLSRLHQFPVDRVKIDRSFVARIEDDLADRALVKAIIEMARALSLEVVAEGVENERQLALLAEMGCTYAQGWLFAPALPIDDLLSLPLDTSTWPSGGAVDPDIDIASM